MRSIGRLLAIACLLIPVGFAALALNPARALAVDTGCEDTTGYPQQAWGQGPRTINVDVDLSEAAQVTAVQTAFSNWQNSYVGHVSQITFNVRQLPAGQTPTGQYLIEENFGLPANEAAATTTVPTPQPVRTSATTFLNGNSGLSSEADALERIMAHEIGHTFGLPDVYTDSITGFPCAPGTSVMGPMDPSNPDLSLTGPSSNDQNRVVEYDYPPPPPDPGGCSGIAGIHLTRCSPVIIDVDGSGFHLTDADHGVIFDIAGNGHPVRIAWIARGSTNAFLVLPRGGRVDNGRELFGNLTPQPASGSPNGFAALAVWDTPSHGGNGDGIIDTRDAIYGQLRLWQDTNHDGIAQPGELHTLPALGITAISLNYRAVPGHDRSGNAYGYATAVTSAGRAAPVAYDFFLTISPASPGPDSPAPVGLVIGLLSAAAATAVLSGLLTRRRKVAARPDDQRVPTRAG